MKLLRKIFLYLFFLLFAGAALTVYLSREFLLPFNENGTKVRFVIPKEMPVTQIAEALEEKEIIRHAWSFIVLVRTTKTGNKIQAGTYDLSPASSEYEILKNLIRGEVSTIRVTIPEGYTLKQIAKTLEEKSIAPAQDFLETTQNASFEINGKTIKNLEGFLFPDTYDLPQRITSEEAYQPMLERLKELVIPLLKKSKNHMDLKQIITLASLIEREAKLPKEYPIIAAVYYNRLKKGMPLQCDATIQYLLPESKEILTDEDLKIDSPYNTYLYKGLPPGPIGSPGLASIKAALFPAKVPYLYYVVRGDSGGHLFSTTYEEHLHNVSNYQHWLQHRAHEK